MTEEMTERKEKAVEKARIRAEKRRARKDARLELRSYLGEVTFIDKLRMAFEDGDEVIDSDLLGL